MPRKPRSGITYCLSRTQILDEGHFQGALITSNGLGFVTSTQGSPIKGIGTAGTLGPELQFGHTNVAKIY
jgi:hypothetical protein